jgi:two-component sensor histidine kinase
VQRTFGRHRGRGGRARCRTTWLLPEAESIPVALTLNELLTNAVKHGAGRRRALRLRARARA